jgi:exodeoxyribonuclease VIII
MITTGVSWEDYKKVERMNPSTLVAGCRSMLRLRRLLQKGFGEETNAMRLGTGIHALLLEPEEFEERFCVRPDFHLMPGNVTGKGEPSTSTATTFCKRMLAEFEAEHAGRIILNRAQYDTALHCIEAIRSRPAMVEIIQHSNKEVTVYGEIDGVPCKGRIDLLSPAIICDLKTTADVEPRAFGRTFANLRYAFKLAMYRELVRQNTCDREVKVIAQETAGDFDNVLYDVPGIVLDNALNKVRSVLADYKHAVDTGVWHGVDRGSDEVPVLIPAYAMDEDEQGLDWSGVATVEDSDTESYF